MFLNYFKKSYKNCTKKPAADAQISAILLFLKNVLTNTNHTLEKLELLLKTSGYRVRYEKGNFKTGACLLQNSRIIVVNKFANLESRIAAVADLARTLDIDQKLLDEKQSAFLNQLKQTSLQF